MVLGMLVLVALAVVLVMWVLSQQRRLGRGPAVLGMSAREALDHRLVSGEITTDMYDQLRAKLDSSPGPPAAADVPSGRE